jgi:endonuclease YncB( thermonuclease family)
MPKTKDKEVYNYKCTLVKVVDGDTIDVDIDLGFDVWLRNQRVRLHGIDTPESRTRNKAEKVLGLAAKEFLNSTVSEQIYDSLYGPRQVWQDFGYCLFRNRFRYL